MKVLSHSVNLAEMAGMKSVGEGMVGWCGVGWGWGGGGGPASKQDDDSIYGSSVII